MPTSYLNHYLHIDLTTGKSTPFSLPQEVLTQYVGGKGVGAYLLAQHQDPKAEPFDPANPLIFVMGPLTGTQAPSMRSGVIFQSPVTRLFTDSYYGGFFGQELRSAGYDGLLLTGRAPELSLLEIDNDRLTLKSAADLRGLDTYEVYDRLRPAYPQKDWRIACIGPAGENLVKFAVIDCDPHRQAGRGGGGAVMGAKNLKAIVVRGTHRIPLADPDAFKVALRATLATMKDNASLQGFRSGGTAASIPWADVEGLLPTRNFQRGSFAGAAALGDEAQRAKFWDKDTACAACPIACSKDGTIKEGEHEGLKGDTLEYESAAHARAATSRSATRSTPSVSACCATSSAWTLFRRARCSALRARRSKRACSTRTCVSVTRRVSPACCSTSHIAMERATCWLRACARPRTNWAATASDFAIHVKGLELPAWGPRGAPGMGLAYMTGDRGGCHQRAFPILYEVGGETWKGQTYERLALDGKAQLTGRAAEQAGRAGHHDDVRLRTLWRHRRTIPGPVCGRHGPAHRAG